MHWAVVTHCKRNDTDYWRLADQKRGNNKDSDMTTKQKNVVSIFNSTCGTKFSDSEEYNKVLIRTFNAR